MPSSRSASQAIAWSRTGYYCKTSVKYFSSCCSGGRKTVVLVSHIQRIGCQPKKLLCTVTNPARGLLNRKKKREQRESLATYPPPPQRCSFGENRTKSSDASTYLGATQVSVRLAPDEDSSARRRGQWVSLHKMLRFRVRYKLSRSPRLPLLLAMSSCVYLFCLLRGHEPSPTLRDRLDPHLSLSYVIASQFPAVPNDWISLCKQSVHSFCSL